jgi:hypothetical protein
MAPASSPPEPNSDLIIVYFRRPGALQYPIGIFLWIPSSRVLFLKFLDNWDAFSEEEVELLSELPSFYAETAKELGPERMLLLLEDISSNAITLSERNPFVLKNIPSDFREPPELQMLFETHVRDSDPMK